MTKHEEIAKWLYDKIISEETVYQETVVNEIADKYGADYTYTNDNGNLAIDKKVLDEFRKLKVDTIIWDKSLRFWHAKNDIDRFLEEQNKDLENLL